MLGNITSLGFCFELKPSDVHVWKHNLSVFLFRVKDKQCMETELFGVGFAVGKSFEATI